MKFARLDKTVRFALVVSLTTLAVGPLTGCKMFQKGPTLPQRPPMSDSLPHLESSAELQAAQLPEKTLTPEQKANMQCVMAASFEKEEPEKAIEVYSKVVKNDPKRSAAFHRLAILYDKTGKHEQAFTAYKSALKNDSKNCDLHCDMGYSLYLQRRWAEAEESFKQALSLNPDLARAHNNYGLLLVRSGRAEEALWEFARAGCTEPEARANMAHAYMLERQWEQAQEQCRIGLAIPSASEPTKAKLNRLSGMISRGGAIATSLPAVDQG